MEELAPGVFAVTECRGANPGFVLTDEGAIVIDTPQIPAEARELRKTIERLNGGKPILYVINTDHHRGHILGNQWFQPAPVIAHDVAWKHMNGYTENFKQRVYDSFRREPEIQAQFTDLEIIKPTLTFSRRLYLFLGGREIRIIWVGGHTPATSIVWLPAERVVFVGDAVWVDQHPYMGQANSKEWLEGLTYIRRLDAEYIVPGHGPVCGREATERMSEYIRHMRSRVRSLYRAGKSKQETANLLVGELLTWFPIPRERRSRIESQIKSGIGRVWAEIHRDGASGDE
ncbi:MAG TPA: MBL fold metallo-hydrolase [Caldilineae bacterium]|nr:MBL fold metallo-hydrolase [Caldilineae bacterium]